MTDFGRHFGFYDRQIKTFGTISKAQAAAKDADTGEPVGDIPVSIGIVADEHDRKTNTVIAFPGHGRFLQGQVTAAQRSIHFDSR